MSSSAAGKEGGGGGGGGPARKMKPAVMAVERWFMRYVLPHIDLVRSPVTIFCALLFSPRPLSALSHSHTPSHIPLTHKTCALYVAAAAPPAHLPSSANNQSC